MSIAERIGKGLFYILQVIFCIIIMSVPEYGYSIIFLFLIASFIIRGIGMRIYYFTLARYMVGGKKLFYRGIVYLDLGIILLSASVIPRPLLTLYLAGTLLWEAGVLGLGAFSKRQAGQRFWWISLIHCVILFLGAVLCVFFKDNHTLVLYLFAGNLIYESVVNFVEAVKPSDVIFIQ